MDTLKKTRRVRRFDVIPSLLAAKGGSTVKRLFARFEAHPKEAGYLAMGGQIVGAGIVAVPRQRTTDEQRVIVKAGSIPEERIDFNDLNQRGLSFTDK